jgi:CheY-like chemotaxis protein
MTEAGQSGQHVLVIDDEAQIRLFVRAGMELGGYRVSEAANGRDALREMTRHLVNLVILDLALPDIDGSEVLERIRAWSSVPVIILSVRAGETEKVRLLELGADDYVVKPFFMSELLARAKMVLRRQSERNNGESALRLDRLAIDFAAHRRAGRQTPQSNPEGVSLASGSGAAPGEGDHPPEPSQQRVGPGSRQRYAVFAHLRAQAETEDRDRPEPSENFADRIGRWLLAQ